MSISPLPNNFISKILYPKYRIHEKFKVMGGGGVAVEVDRAGGLEDAVELGEALGHHGEVGHHVILAEEQPEGLHEGLQLFIAAGADKLRIGHLRLGAPLPGILEGGNLGGGPLAGPLLEEDVVGGVGIEGRVKVDEVHRRVRDVVAKEKEVIVAVALVCPVSHGGLPKFFSNL